MVVAFQGGDQHVGQITPGVPVEADHDAEVDGDDAAVDRHPHVAGMLIAVEKAVEENQVDEHLGQIARASWRERVGQSVSISVVAVSLKKTKIIAHMHYSILKINL